MIKHLLLLIMTLLPWVASAYDAKIDGLYYNFNSKEKSATVTYQSYNDGRYMSNYLGNIIIPNEVVWMDAIYNVTSIGDYAFCNSENLESLIIPTSIISIGQGAFQNCNSLKSIDIPNSITSIGYAAFYACSKLTSVEIPKKVTCIEERSFANCVNLNSVIIPSSVTSIGAGAFSNCYDLTSIDIPNSIISIGNSAFAGSGLISVSIPISVTEIEDFAFAGTRIKTINITDLAAWCRISSVDFYLDSKLYLNEEEIKELEISGDIKEIGTNAFKYCPSITSVKVHWKRPLAGGADSFLEDVKKNATLYVPKGTASMYMSAPGWIEFENIVEYDEEASISQLETTADTDTDWYTLDGRKLNDKPTEKGVYINNGKKIYVK